jgi:serine/threonine protein kinase
VDGDPTLTAALILWAQPEVFPPDLSSQCAAFILDALTKDPAARPAAAQLLRHPWILGHLDGTIAAGAQKQQQQQVQGAGGAGGWLRCAWDGLASLLPFLRGNQVQPEQQQQQRRGE